VIVIEKLHALSMLLVICVALIAVGVLVGVLLYSEGRRLVGIVRRLPDDWRADKLDFAANVACLALELVLVVLITTTVILVLDGTYP
jgi:hypothetical protein